MSDITPEEQEANERLLRWQSNLASATVENERRIFRLEREKTLIRNMITERVHLKSEAREQRCVVEKVFGCLYRRLNLSGSILGFILVVLGLVLAIVYGKGKIQSSEFAAKVLQNIEKQLADFTYGRYQR